MSEADEPIRIPVGAHDGTAPLPPAAPPTDAGPPPEAVSEATDGSAAGRLRAKQAELSRSTKEFGLPGWFNTETGNYDLVLVPKSISDRKRLAAGMTNEQLIVAATARILERTDDGELVEIEGCWAGVGAALGITGDVTLGKIVRTTLAIVDEAGEVVEAPLRVDGLAEQLIAWMMGRRSQIEQALGE